MSSASKCNKIKQKKWGKKLHRGKNEARKKQGRNKKLQRRQFWISNKS